MLVQFLDSRGVKKNLSRPFPVFRVVYIIHLPSGNAINKSRDTRAHKMINKKRYCTVRDCLVPRERAGKSRYKVGSCRKATNV